MPFWTFSADFLTSTVLLTCVACLVMLAVTGCPVLLADRLLLLACLQLEAGKEKDLGNKAFAAKDYDTAIQHFTKCISLDPK